MTDSLPDAETLQRDIDEFDVSMTIVLDGPDKDRVAGYMRELKQLRAKVCTWTPIPDHIDAYETCASIKHVPRDAEGPALPAYCEDCGGAVVA